jgi:hypothetical protein
MKFEVQAPIDLECGYPLEVDIDGNTVTVAVPYNVKAGEIIPCKSLLMDNERNNHIPCSSFVYVQLKLTTSSPRKLPLDSPRLTHTIIQESAWLLLDDGDTVYAIAAISAVFLVCGGMHFASHSSFGVSF